jgi:hypothetical protein
MDQQAVPLRLAESFSPEQRVAAEALWQPLLKWLQLLLPDLVRIDCLLTPNGLVLEGRDGWVITLCSLEDQCLPHIVTVRQANPKHEGRAIKAHFNQGSYKIDSATDADPKLMQLLRICIRHLTAPVSIRPAKSRQAATATV